jgi:HD superfamily phosphohydrolase
MVPKTRAVQLLLEERDLINVLPAHDYRMTRAGAAVLHTRPMQRLARLRQVGLGHLAWPNAENSRLSHSIGTEYWVVRFLHSLTRDRRSAGSADASPLGANRIRLHAMDDALGSDISLELVARLFALVHDFALLPLGHTLQYQLGFFRGAGAEAHRAAQCLDWVRAEIAATPEMLLLAESERDDVLRALLAHLDVVECVACAGQLLDERRSPVLPQRVAEATFLQWLPVLTFLYDLTHAIFSADLIDFALRDSAAAGIPRVFDERLLEHLCVFELPAEGAAAEALGSQRGGVHSTPLYRFGLQAFDGHVLHHVVTAATSLYRVRYEVAERVFYHPAKCAADAMLDRALRTIDADTHWVSDASGPFREHALLRIGDDGLLDLVATLEEEALARSPNGDGPPVRPVAPEILGRRLFVEAHRVSSTRELAEQSAGIVARATDATVRGDVERRILAQLPELATGDVIFSSRPLSMQVKEPDILLGWRDGEVCTLRDVAESEGYGQEALAIAQRYHDLWSLSVYLRPDRMQHAPRVREVSERMLGPTRALVLELV